MKKKPKSKARKKAATTAPAAPPQQPKKKGGARAGAGRKKRTIDPVELIDGRTVTGQQHAQWLIDELHADFDPTEPDSLEVAGWRRLWDALDKRIALETRRYLYDKAKGKATITVNHLHDKPIDLNVTMPLSQRLRTAMEKAEQRLRDKK
ncbi:MAG TPA: hypothetical protein VFF58_00595 [Candidatus Nitrosotalea sp.]|nr:hypothetical protein [Candidatus Nitrosotalea sp.]